MSIPKKIEEVYRKSSCIYTKEQVETALSNMADEIHLKLAEENPIFMCVMVGGLITMGHLLTRLDFPLEVDYVHATRYRGSTRGGDIHWKAKPNTDLQDRTVLVVDDILDGGITLNEIVKYCQQAGAKKVHTAVLVDKKHTRVEGGLAVADFTGLTVEDRYIFGYGMDYEEYLRNAPGIFEVAAEHE